jgi:hypothetical protein
MLRPAMQSGCRFGRKCSFDVFTESRRWWGCWWIFHARDAWVATRIISCEALVTSRALFLGLLLLVETLKLDQDPIGELRVLDCGYTDQVLLDTISQEVLRIKATVCNSLQDLNKLYMVDRALYTNTPGIPLYMEFTPQNMRSMKTPLIISEVKLYTVERVWGMRTLRITR